MWICKNPQIIIGQGIRRGAFYIICIQQIQRFFLYNLLYGQNYPCRPNSFRPNPNPVLSWGDDAGIIINLDWSRFFIFDNPVECFFFHISIILRDILFTIKKRRFLKWRTFEWSSKDRSVAERYCIKIRMTKPPDRSKGIAKRFRVFF